MRTKGGLHPDAGAGSGGGCPRNAGKSDSHRGTAADCSQLRVHHLLADKAYDTNEIIDTATERGMNPVIPPKRNRREKREYDRALYKLRHLVGNGFLDFKQWRGVATRYAKNSLSYLAICQIRAMMIWTKLI